MNDVAHAPAPGLLSQTAEAYGEEYRRHLMEQYRLYVEMSERLSSRRMLANSFFTGMNTAVVGALAIALKERLIEPVGLILAPVTAALLMCVAWWLMIVSYRKLNGGKFEVILAMERLLPLAPFTAEWAVLGRGEQGRRYRPITSVELLVPWLFASIHVALAIVFLASS